MTGDAIYRPLQPGEIRLLQLSPRHSKSTVAEPASLEVSLAHAFLDQNPEFDALSYAWGVASDTRTITLQGQPYQITVNLFNALRDVSFDDKPRTLWADALCINQSDRAEREEQVALMRRIYKQAVSVAVYLGEAWDGHELALELFRATATQKGLHYEPSMDPHLTIDGHDLNSLTLRRNLVRFLELPWWKRLWTAQEYVLAQRVGFQCGETVIDGTYIQQGYANLRRHYKTCCWDSPSVSRDATFGQPLLYSFMRMEPTEAAREQSGGHNNPDPSSLEPVSFAMTLDPSQLSPSAVLHAGPHTFLEALDIFRTREASDDRDKVYGITGLYFADTVADFFVKPDYRLNAEELYTSVTNIVIRETKKLNILSRAAGYCTPALSLPSYVPDWSVSLDTLADRNALMSDILYDASGGSEAHWVVLSSRSALTKAVLVDTVERIGQPWQRGMCAGMEGIMRNWASVGNFEFTDNSFGEEAGVFAKSSAFWRTLCGDAIAFGLLDGQAWEHLDRAEPKEFAQEHQYRAYLTWYAFHTGRSGAEHSSMVADFQAAFDTVTTGRTFAATRSGRTAMIPVEAQPGDVVAVMPGGPVPFVLRLVSDSIYRLIGAAFVRGIMKGEALQVNPPLETIQLV